MTPIIGVTTAIGKNSFRTIANVGYEYIDKIEKANGIPFLIPVLNDFTKTDLEKIIFSLDGIIFTGGENIDSHWYGEEPRENIVFGQEIRNKFEKELFYAAKKIKKPILGICRGCQLINVLQGGSLYQNINIELKNKLDHIGNGRKLSDKYHSVIIEKDSFLFNVFNVNEIKVNSFHIQAIKDLGQNLKATAISEDGLIEAIEYTGDFFMKGVQYHPEALEDQLPLFQGFIKVINGGV